MFTKVMFVFLAVFLASPAFGQNCGQGELKKLYSFAVLGMDEAQGGSQVEGNLQPVPGAEGSYTGDAKVINGYDFQYRVANLSDQRCGIDFSFRLGNGEAFWFLNKTEAENTYRMGRASLFALLDIIGPWSRFTRTITLAPGASGLKMGWVEIRQDGNYERMVSVGTIRLYQNGEVVSQFSMRPVEAKLVNYVAVFNAPRDNQRTGFAVGNPYFEEVRVVIQLLGRNGAEVGRVEKTLGVYGNFSLFVNELFQIPPYFEGILKITGTREVPVTAIVGRVSQDKFLMSLVGAN